MQERIEKLMLSVLLAKAVEIRDLDNGEEPFLYSSGNWGPGYVTIKGLVGRKLLMKTLAQELAKKIAVVYPDLHFVAGNVSGGIVPGWLLSEYLEAELGRTVPFVYIRDTRKKGGQKELITGLANNPEIPIHGNALVVEELVNFAQTTCNGAYALRDALHNTKYAACILFYGNPKSIEALSEAGIEMIYLFTLQELLNIAEKHKTHPQKAIDGYREFLKNPLKWQADRNLEPIKSGGTK